MEASEAVPVHVSGEYLSLTHATLLYCWTRWAHLLLLQHLAVSAESLMNFSGVPISTSASRRSVGQGIRCFIISMCLYRKQRQSSPVSHFPERCVCREDWWEALATGATIVHCRALPLCKVENMSCSHARYEWRQALVSLLLGCVFSYICYLVRDHFLNVSGDIKRLLFLFIKQWLKSSQKQPPYFSSLLTPNPSLSHTLSSLRPSFCATQSCSYWRQCEMTQLKVPSHSLVLKY